MKKLKLLLVAGIVLATKIGFSQSNNLKIGGQDLDNGDYVGSNNNKNLTIRTNGQVNTIFKKEGGIEVKRLASFDSVNIGKYMRVDSIHARSIRVGNNSLWLGSPVFQNQIGLADYIQSDNGVINFGKYSGPLPYNPSLFSQFKMGIGFINPQFNVHIHDAQAGPNDVKQSFSNQGTGASSSDGFQIGILSNQSAILRQQELNQPVNIVTQGGFVGANNSNNSFFIPRSLFHISDGAAATNYQVTNNATGVLATDGFKLGITNTGTAVINQQENLPLQFHTNNTQRAVILANGRTGINNVNPLNRFVVTTAATDIGGGNVLTPGGSSGIRTTNMTSATPTLTGNGKVVTVNAAGDWYLTADGGGSTGPATVTAQNGLNTTVASPAVELGGTLIRPTYVDQLSNDMGWGGNGTFNIGDQLTSAATTSSLNPRFLLHDNSHGTSMHLINQTGGGNYGMWMSVEGFGGTNYAQRIRVSNGSLDNIGTEISVVGAGGGGNITQGISAEAFNGGAVYGGIFYANPDNTTLNGFGTYSQLNMGTNYFARHAGSSGFITGTANATKYAVFGCTDENNTDKNVAVGGVIGSNGTITEDICDGVNVKNIAIYGGFANPGLAPNFNSAAAGNYAGYFDGHVNITGDLTVVGSYPSDVTLKTNIDTITNALATIKLLQPKQFYYDTTKYFLASHGKKQYGLLAQDVINVLPELVGSYGVADKKDTLGNIISVGGTFKNLNYNALIGILIKGVQEQQRTIDSIRTVLSNTTSARIINPVSDPNSNTNAISINKQNVTLSNADALVLDQNQPNPFSESTVIKYNVPEKYGYAQLIFTTIEGRILKTIDITKKGAGEITVYANDLSNGIYTYTLVVDGKTVDTKKMVKQ